MKDIVSTKWLNQNLDHPNLIILDASIASNASGKVFEKSESTIPNARRFDLKNVFSDTSSVFPNTIPNPHIFERECQKLGINQDSEIVVFDANGMYSSPRAWWLFHVMGHENIAVLDGGLPKWIQNGFRTEQSHLTKFETGNFKANFNKDLLISFEQVSQNIIKKDFLIVDARSKGRFNGTEQEPRKHLKSGHIPNSVNIPHQDVLSDGMFKSKDELKVLFKHKCHGEKKLVFSCGSGLTACIVLLACRIGYTNTSKLYDGSWTEWAERNDLKV
ncbi:sulfurtransferase [Psychroserpens sp. XS_ASV72]|uniref:sulfurtransferase n=1 Tax=Psychroserpens sp. XS_ASV72 TaxID=3241293 RepID=UPI003511FF83